MSKHTPGPWEIKGFEDMAGFYCLFNHVERFEEALESDDPKIQEPIFKEERANARLIAQSPRMLEALNEVSSYFAELIGNNLAHDREIELNKIIESALARAGE